MDTEALELDLISTRLFVNHVSDRPPEHEAYRDRGFVRRFCDASWHARNDEPRLDTQPHYMNGCFRIRNGGSSFEFEIFACDKESLGGVAREIHELDTLIAKMVRLRNAAAGTFNRIVLNDRKGRNAQ